MFADEMAGVDRFLIRARFRNLFSVKIDHETMRDADLVGRAIVERDARHKRRLKPAAMLIGRLEIHVRWIAQLRMKCAHGFVRNAAVDPNVDRIIAVRRALRQPKFFGKIDILQLKPNV